MTDPRRESYEPCQFWESRLQRRFNLAGVGYEGLGEGLNYWLYRVRRHILLKTLRRLGVDPVGKSVLELGCGTGFYVRLWKELGVRSLTGIDITAVATGKLSQAFPEHRFLQADISDCRLNVGEFDLVTAFDVLFHITDDRKFETAIANLAGSCRPGGYVLATDLFLHRERLVGFHQKSRLLDDYLLAFAHHGLRPLGRFPVFTLMQPGPDTKTVLGRRLAATWWRNFLRASCWPNRAIPGWGYIFGALMYPLEVGLSIMLQEGISLEIMVAKRELNQGGGAWNAWSESHSSDAGRLQ